MKVYNFFYFSLIALLMLSNCTDDDDSGLPADGTSCPGGNNFIVQDGACACPEDYILVGRPPSVLGEHVNEGMCIPRSDGALYILATYNNCKCTDITNGTPDSVLLTFGYSFLNARYFAHSGPYAMIPETYWKDEPEGQEIYVQLINGLGAPGWAEPCEDYHEGIYGSLHEFFPNGETRIEGKIRWWATWADFNGDAAPVDSCNISLERVPI